MTIRSVRFLVVFAVATTVAKGDEPAKSAGAGSVIQGRVVTAGGKPLEGARVLVSAFASGMSFVDEAAATTDARGKYRLSLGQFPWAKGCLGCWCCRRASRSAIESSSQVRLLPISSSPLSRGRRRWCASKTNQAIRSQASRSDVSWRSDLGAAEVRSRRVHPARDGTGALGRLGRETR